MLLQPGGASTKRGGVRPRLWQALVLVSLASAVWSLVLMLTGGFELRAGLLKFSSHASPLLPLILAICAGLLAWAVWMDGEQRPLVISASPRRKLWFACLIVAMIVGLNLLILKAPAPSPGVDACGFVRELKWGFRHLLNCDSLGLLTLAQQPSLILTPGHLTRQSRPLSVVLPYVVASVLRPVSWITESDFYRPFAAEFIAYALINLAILMLSVVWFTGLLERGERSTVPGIELLSGVVFLGVNDLTKQFIWSPHVQIFNLFVSCLALLVSARLIERREPLGLQHAALLGLAMGVGFLQYGSFVIPVACAATVQMLVYRRVVVAILLAGVAFIPYLCWVLFVHLTTGRFYNHEIEAYRQFVWIADCAKPGFTRCAPIVASNLSTFVSTAAPIVLPAIAAIGCCRIALRLRARGSAPARSGRPVHLAIALTLGISTVFLALMGFYAARLCWLLMPPLLLMLSFDMKALRLSLKTPDSWRFKAAVLAGVTVYVLQLVLREGPYS